MKKILFLFMIFVIILSGGCNNKNKLFLDYNKSNIKNTDNIYPKENLDFFSKDLIIIPSEYNNGNDESLTSSSSLLINLSDKELIYADNVYTKLYPASLTKLFTTLVVLKHGELMDNVTIGYNSSNILEPGAKTCGFKEGDIVTLETLLNSFLVYSGNDAGIAIAEHLAGSEEAFVKLMNDEAKNIGALHSNFINPHGLHDENHYTSAYDVYLVFNELIKYDVFISIIGQSSYIANYLDKEGNTVEKNFKSTNGYLNGQINPIDDLSIIGGKTGYTSKAGNCLVLLSKDKDDKNYISIILNTNSNEELYSQMNILLSKTN
ncbi:MAG TPA: D-alanyl-D-alanine carboxypeptidase [Clostridiales bacterium]|nr:D-alanyl-D-alanine carboxypeptidase [Clostridiales bacterium]